MGRCLQEGRAQTRRWARESFMPNKKQTKTELVGFDDFKRMAVDPKLSRYEKIGFPDSYRAGKEDRIFADILSKLGNLSLSQKRVLDIGPGCSGLPKLIIDLCGEHNHELLLVDSSEMLSLLPDADFIKKIAARYPDCPSLFEAFSGKIDVLICYSVLHYIFVEIGFYGFLDLSLSLLAPGGQMLIGDIPNISKRHRFFSSETGIRFHQAFMKTDDLPQVTFNEINFDQIDDAVIMSIVQRSRSQGFDAYVVPQPDDLPMANRREDIVIVRP